MGGWIFRGLLAIALCYYLLEGAEYSPHAARLPQMVAGATIVFLFVDAIVTWRKERRAKAVEGSSPSRPTRLSFESPRFYATVFCLIVFFFLLPWLGYILSSVLFIFGLCWLLGERRWQVLLVCSVAVPIAFWYASEEYLKVIMPTGVLFEAFFK